MLKRSFQNGLERSKLTLNGEEEANDGSVKWMLVVTCVLCVFGSSLVHGYNTGVLNAPEFTIQTFYNDTYIYRYQEPIGKSLLNFLWAFTVSIYLVGGMVGIFSAGYFADKFGRRGALQFSHVFAIIAAIFFGIARPSCCFEFVIVGRLVVGFSAGLGSGVVPMYLTESSPKHVRGSLGVLHQLGLTIGILLSQILGLEEIFGSDDLWPVLLIFTAVPGCIVFFFLPFVPESPRYLLIKKNNVAKAKEDKTTSFRLLLKFRLDNNKAEILPIACLGNSTIHTIDGECHSSFMSQTDNNTALKSFRGEDHNLSVDVEEMREEQRQLEAEPPWTMKQLLKAKKLRFPLLLLCALQVGQQLSGINVVFYYSTGVFKEAGIPDESVRYATLGTGAINVAMTIVAVYLMEKAGRRPLLLYGMIGMAISSAIITIGLNVQHVAPEIAYVSFVCTLTFVVSFAMGLGPIPLFLGGELFKQGPRPAAMSFSGMLNWLANFVVGITFPFILDGLKGYTFLPFMTVVTIGAAVTFKYVKETKNRTYEEIAQMYYGKDGGEPDANGKVVINGIKMEERTDLL